MTTALDPFAVAAAMYADPPNYGHTYTARGACAEAFTSDDSEVLVSGPAGTGKSRACLEKVHHLALAYPGMQALVVRKTATSLTSSGLVTWEKFVIPEAEEADAVAFFGGNQKEPAAYRYSNGSRVVVGGMDKASKIMSTEYDVVFVQEATELTADDWERITTRLRNGVTPHQQLLADCNPNVPTHWLKRRADEGQTVMLESRHEDNPVLFADDGSMTPAGRDYIEGKLDKLTGVRHQRLRRGLWVAAEGQIYDDFDQVIHVVDALPRGSDGWTRWWAIDFGYTNPFVLQWWAEDPDGRLWLYRELYRTQRLVEDHAKDALAIVAPGGVWSEPKPRGIICDHDAEGRATLQKHLGMSTTAARKAVTDGIQAVQTRLKPAGDGKPRLFVMRDATIERDRELADAARPASTLDEFAGYVWDVRDGKPPKETPVKDDDHGMDAMRYMVMALDGGPDMSGVEMTSESPQPSQAQVRAGQAHRMLRGRR